MALKALVLGIGILLAGAPPGAAQMDPLWRTGTDVTDAFRQGGAGSEARGVQDCPPATASLVSLTVGTTLYRGVFRPSRRATRWSGDLVMAPLADPARVAWAASGILAAYGSADRRAGKVFTLLPGAAGLTRVAPGDANLLRDLKRALPANAQPTEAGLTRLLWSMLGGDTGRPEAGGPGTGTYPMRPDAMGDVINSAPAMLEYPLERAERAAGLEQPLRSARAAQGGRPRFRILFVGTNQGHLHAFGEVSYDADATLGGNRVRVPLGGAVELWSFIPTEAILSPWYLDDVNPLGVPNPSPNPHICLADGAPLAYFQPGPGAGSGLGHPRRKGDARVHPGDTALLVFGLGKGGRSTYCLDLGDPLNPVLRWALRPDEVTAAGNRFVRSMGLSTSRPAIARAVNAGGRVADFLVLGGGFSDGSIERALARAPVDARTDARTDARAGEQARPFGRSLVLFDVNRGPGAYRTGPGDVIGFDDPAMGPVSAGGVPAECAVGSGMAQRIYFPDRSGGVWVLGAPAAEPSRDRGRPGPESSRVADWVLRPVFRAQGVFSTLPEVFTLPYGRIPGTATPAMGLVLGTGDRNNPMDRPGPHGRRNRLFLVFDARDLRRRAGGLDEGDLADLTGVSRGAEADPAAWLKVDPGTRKPAFLGFRLDLPDPRGKIIHDPLVTHGALFFSVFTPGQPAGTPCAAGGLTETYRAARAWSPMFGGGGRATPARCPPDWEAASGKVEGARFGAIAGDLVPLGDAQVLQAGRDPGAGGAWDAPAPVIRRYHGRESRTGMRIRAWRIAR